MAQAPLAVIACWILARDISGSLYTATPAALLIVFSPVFVLYGGQVMTDVPSVLLLAIALIVHLRGMQAEEVLDGAGGRGAAGVGRQPSRDDRILCAVVGAGAVCSGMEVSAPGSLVRCRVVRLCLRCWRLVGLPTGSSPIRITVGFGMVGVNRCARSRRDIRSRSRTSVRTLCTISSARRWFF